MLGDMESAGKVCRAQEAEKQAAGRPAPAPNPRRAQEAPISNQYLKKLTQDQWLKMSGKRKLDAIPLTLHPQQETRGLVCEEVVGRRPGTVDGDSRKRGTGYSSLSKLLPQTISSHTDPHPGPRSLLEKPNGPRESPRGDS
jgi:hypothetical protein